MPKFFGLETSFQTVFIQIAHLAATTRYFASGQTKKRLEMKEFTIQPSFFVNQIYPKVLLVVFWTKFANCNGSLPHLALAKCLQLLLQALTIVRL